MKKNLKAIQKVETKKRILNVATRLFKKQGYKATGIDQIMQEASLTAGAFYAHFESKDDLFENCLQLALAESAYLLTKETDNLSGLEKTNVILKRYCSEAHRDFPDKGCILPSLASEIYRSSNKVSQIVAVYIEKWAALISKNLDEKLSESEKNNLALQLISRSVGSVLLSRIVKETKLSQQILLASQKLGLD